MEVCILTSSTPLIHRLSLPRHNHNNNNHNNSLFSGYSCRGGGSLRPLKLRLKVTASAVDDDDSTKLTQHRTSTTNDSISTLNNVSASYNHSTQQQPSSSDDDDEDESLSNESAQPFQDFVDSLRFKSDSEDSYVLLLYGGGSLVAVWLLTAIVGAIDALPVLPKLMEVVGLGYSLWFTTRYLLFKKNRKELSAKIEELKREVLGSDDE